MDDILGETLQRIAGTDHQSIGYSKNVPQYGDTVSLSLSLFSSLGAPDVGNDNQPPEEINPSACSPDEAKREAA
jgi:hypothetical protein